jgi:hypothetical protein
MSTPSRGGSAARGAGPQADMWFRWPAVAVLADRRLAPMVPVKPAQSDPEGRGDAGIADEPGTAHRVAIVDRPSRAVGVDQRIL